MRTHRTSASSGEQGFTLIEVLVALTILSVSVTVLFGIFTQVLDRTRQDMLSMQARALTHRLLTEAEISPPAKSRQGTDAAGWSWRLNVADPHDESASEPTKKHTERLSATVRWMSAGQRRTVTEDTAVIAPSGETP